MTTDAVPTWPGLITALVEHRDLTAQETGWAMDAVMAGDADPVALAGFLVALRAKGETVEELRGLADGMLAHAVPFDVEGPAVDIVGTGGDRAQTVNISTMAAVVVAGAGVRVVKHGNRAASSRSGAADVLESLGVRLDHEPARLAQVYADTGITFCFAQLFHPSFRHAGVVRSKLGIATVFNFLGPLTNPAQPAAAAIGSADARMGALMAGVLASRGTSALVFRSSDGLDELAATGEATVWEVAGGEVHEHRIDPATTLGLSRIDRTMLRGSTPDHNADVARRLLDGEGGPVRETVLLNAAAAFVADGSLEGTATGTLEQRLAAGLQHAARSVDSGAARETLARWVAATA